MPGAIGNANGVDLNSASREELERVGGLGPDRAQRIVQQRPIRRWEDLRKIEGFSDTLVQDLRQAGATIEQKAA
jgi:DNA uptake protein ComE-like DNA-binding protein